MRCWAAPTKFLQRCVGDRVLARHARSGRQHPVCADKIAAQPNALAREPHRFLVIAPDELGIRSDAVVDRRERVALAQAQRATGSSRPPLASLGSKASGANYRRLSETKGRYDPENLFRMNQNIRPVT